MSEIFALTGVKVMHWAQSCGEVVILTRRTLGWMIRAPWHRKNVLNQMIEMGAKTFPVASLTVFFTGMVMALQTGSSFIRTFNEPLYVGRLIGISIVKELGPVLTALVFSGRIGAAIAAELGTMKVTEQIDALHTLGTNPVRYLAVPRFIAAITMLPLLTVYSNFLGILGGFVVAVVKFRISSAVYWEEIYALRLQDVVHGLAKSVIFALIVVSIACYKGLTTEDGAEGVGKSTTSAVVNSMVIILLGDYFATAILVAFGIG